VEQQNAGDADTHRPQEHQNKTAKVFVARDQAGEIDVKKQNAEDTDTHRPREQLSNKIEMTRDPFFKGERRFIP
jgi:hypothetical protein